MDDHQAILNQNAVEARALGHFADAIRSAVAWPLPRRQPGRKVATVRYLCQLYRQMLERALAIEENDGFMDALSDSDSRFESQVEKFRREHAAIRCGWQEVAPRLDRVSAVNETEFEQICEQVNSLLDQMDRHLQRESDALVDASLIDLGGEGG